MQLSIAVLFLTLGVVVAEDPLATRRNINLILVNDNRLYRKFFGSDVRRVRDFNRKVVFWINQVYDEVNVSVTLIRSEIWKDGDKVHAKNMTDLLGKISKWASHNMYSRYHYHSLHIITGKKYSDEAVGVGYQSQVCQPNSVGADNYAVDYVQQMKDPIEYMGILVAVSRVISSALLISSCSSTKWATTWV